jgi:hypothetical protein
MEYISGLRTKPLTHRSTRPKTALRFSSGELGVGLKIERRRMPAVFIFGYIIAFSLITRLILPTSPPQWAVWLVFVAFIIGWFLVIGVMTATDSGVRGISRILHEGSAFGISLMRWWLLMSAILFSLALIIFLLFYL